MKISHKFERIKVLIYDNDFKITPKVIQKKKRL